MSHFSMLPPSDKRPVSGLFQGGMEPVGGGKVTHLIVFDLRSLRLPHAEGRAIESVLRDALEKELQKRGLLQNRSKVDISSSVFGIAID